MGCKTPTLTLYYTGVCRGTVDDTVGFFLSEVIGLMPAFIEGWKVSKQCFEREVNPK